MKVLLNTDNYVSGNEEKNAPLIEMVSKELSRFSDQITRVEIHLSDENGYKTGKNDKKCVIEARLEGLQPVAVTNLADSHYDAVKGASEKLKSALDSMIGKLRNY